MGVITETVLVTGGVLALIRFLHVSGAPSLQWIAIPGVLVTAALVPAWIGKREFPRLGLDLDHGSLVAATLGAVCLCVLPVVFFGLWLLTRLNLPVPLRPIVPERQGWPAWLFYQFFYVAVAEEVFFRGYVQGNTARWLRQATRLPRIAPAVIAIFVSAGCFALAHVVVQGQITAALTFVPGLILAWLFLRTGSLLAPILFHGIANVSYALIVLIMARP
ncbi:MAG: CPBP family intramembrane metalloprotease [Planctomycetes bacterium]|nr:CPBP family intramembrane metalloprotease [Planctomycetota bacterium]